MPRKHRPSVLPLLIHMSFALLSFSSLPYTHLVEYPSHEQSRRSAGGFDASVPLSIDASYVLGSGVTVATRDNRTTSELQQRSWTTSFQISLSLPQDVAVIFRSSSEERTSQRLIWIVSAEAGSELHAKSLDPINVGNHPRPQAETTRCR